MMSTSFCMLDILALLADFTACTKLIISWGWRVCATEHAALLQIFSFLCTVYISYAFAELACASPGSEDWHRSSAFKSVRSKTVPRTKNYKIFRSVLTIFLPIFCHVGVFFLK